MTPHWWQQGSNWKGAEKNIEQQLARKKTAGMHTNGKTKKHYPTQVRPTGGRLENYRNFLLHQPTHFDAKPPTGPDHQTTIKFFLCTVDVCENVDLLFIWGLTTVMVIYFYTSTWVFYSMQIIFWQIHIWSWLVPNDFFLQTWNLNLRTKWFGLECWRSISMAWREETQTMNKSKIKSRKKQLEIPTHHTVAYHLTTHFA